MSDLFNYDTSWLNPALKLVNAALGLLITVVYHRSRRHFAGDLDRVLVLLVGMGAAATLAALLRYFGNGEVFGFTAQLSLKWLQGLGYLAQAALFVLVGVRLRQGIIPEIRP